MKKVIASIVALVLCFSFVLSGCSSNKSTGGSVSEIADEGTSTNGSLDTGYGKESDNKIQEGATVASVDMGKEAKIFRAGKFYFEGTIYSGNESGMPVQISSDGKNIQMATQVDGVSLCVLLLDNTPYLLASATKKYIEVSDKVLAAVGLDDFDVSEFTKATESATGEQEIKKQSEVTINGKSGLCTEFESSSGNTKLYTIGDTLVESDTYDSSGKLSMQIAFTSISSSIPSDQLTLKGYEKASSIYSFINGLVS